MVFYFVTPENRDRYRDLMQDFFNKLAKEWGQIALDRYDTQNARYVVCQHPKYGVIGGLRLLPTMGPKLSDETLSGSGIALQDDETWEATKLFFYIPPEDSIHYNPEAFEQLCKGFYSGLWKYLQTTCHIEVLVTLLPETEHQDALHFGDWPFMLESPVTNPFNHQEDEYILGVLKSSKDAEVELAS